MKAIHSRVALDLYRIQFDWAIKFLSFFVFLQIARPLMEKIPYLNMNDKINIGNYFDNIFVFSNVFILVIGIIIASSFLSYYVRSGVTRKDFFKGATIASIGISISIPIVASLFYALLNIVTKLTGFSFMENSELTNHLMYSNMSLVEEIILAIILVPFTVSNVNWLLAIILFMVNILGYYVIGWFIGTAFYRFGVPIGLLSIIFSILFILLRNVLLSVPITFLRDSSLDEALKWDIFSFVHILSAVAFIMLLLICIKQLTKRVAIKI